jgi:hypothetical protein
MHGKILATVTLVILMALPINIMADGTSAADFLNINVSAYQASLGGAGSALSTDIAAGYYNPAGLSMIERSGVNFMHNLWYQDVSYEFLGSAFSVGDKSVLALSGAYLHMGDISSYDAYNQSDGSISPYSFVGIVSYSRNLNDHFSAGLSGKYITEKLDNVEAIGFAFDIGAQYYHDLFTFGIVANNIGPKMNYENDSFSLPASVSFGIAYSPYKLPVSIMTGARVPFDGKASFSAGVEYQMANFLSIRSGLGGLGSENASSVANFGAGFNVAGVDIDYAFNPGGDLGATHFFSFTMNFGDTRKFFFDRHRTAEIIESKPVVSEAKNPASAMVAKQAQDVFVVSAGSYSDEHTARMHIETMKNFGVKGKLETAQDGSLRVVLLKTANLKKAENYRDELQRKGLTASVETE